MQRPSDSLFLSLYIAHFSSIILYSPLLLSSPFPITRVKLKLSCIILPVPLYPRPILPLSSPLPSPSPGRHALTYIILPFLYSVFLIVHTAGVCCFVFSECVLVDLYMLACSTLFPPPRYPINGKHEGDIKEKAWNLTYLDLAHRSNSLHFALCCRRVFLCSSVCQLAPLSLFFLLFSLSPLFRFPLNGKRSEKKTREKISRKVRSWMSLKI